jgi:hypothetical protein
MKKPRVDRADEVVFPSPESASVGYPKAYEGSYNRHDSWDEYRSALMRRLERHYVWRLSSKE